MATFSLVAQALRTGEPIPQAFHQNLLDRLHYHGSVGRQTFKADKAGKEDVHKSQMDHVAEYEYLFYATSICAVFQVIEVSLSQSNLVFCAQDGFQGLNELRTITTRLVGEVPLEGFARWREEYDRAHVMKSA